MSTPASTYPARSSRRPPTRAWVAVSAIVLALAIVVAAQAQDQAASERAAEPSSAEALERTFIVAGRTVAPSVVMITVERRDSASAAGAGANGENPSYRSQPDNGRCTGVIISADGYVITSAFNLSGNVRSAEVTTAAGEVFDADLLGRNERSDLALIKLVGATRLPVPVMADTTDLDVGQFVILVGRGESPVRPSVTTGILSAKEREMRGAIQFDAACNYANTGGALVNLRGELIGIANSIDVGARHGLNSGVAFGMPWHLIERDLPALRAGEVITRSRDAYLGLKPTAAPLGVAGVRVEEVYRDTGAHAAGVRGNDVITAIDDTPVTSIAELRAALRDRRPGDRVALTVLRGTREMLIPVVLGERE